jgi:cytochrome c oxidase assembly protein subunit 15
VPQENAKPLLYRDHRAVSCWLLACALLVVMMVLVGGYTRLSGSGLSITTWRPIHGTLPPLNQTEWQEEFDAYRASPQYQKINKGMSMEEFRAIFWPEYLHRLLGRVVGLAFFIPYLFFLMRKSLSRPFAWRLAGIFALGGLQGLMGWLMVKSGLVDMPRVSHIRLAAHLGLALTILSFILWAWLDITQPKRSSTTNNTAPRWYKIWFSFMCLQIVLGAFMAGLHAGLIYNTYPTMNGQWIPDGLFSMSPIYINFFENITMVQFMHRKLALVVAFGFLFWWFCHRAYVRHLMLVKACAAVALTIAVQFALGVFTLLHQSPLALALTHQMVAVVLLMLAVVLLHGLTGKNKMLGV